MSSVSTVINKDGWRVNLADWQCTRPRTGPRTTRSALPSASSSPMIAVAHPSISPFPARSSSCSDAAPAVAACSSPTPAFAPAALNAYSNSCSCPASSSVAAAAAPGQTPRAQQCELKIEEEETELENKSRKCSRRFGFVVGVAGVLVPAVPALFSPRFSPTSAVVAAALPSPANPSSSGDLSETGPAAL